MAVNSRAKGKQGELEACQELRRLFGFQCRRSQQFSGYGGGDSPDIIVENTPDLFWEIKRVQALNVPRALALAVRQAGRKCPVVMHRPNHSVNGWMLTLRLTDLPRLAHAYQQAVDADSQASSAVAPQALPDADADSGASASQAAGPARVVHRAKRSSGHTHNR